MKWSIAAATVLAALVARRASADDALRRDAAGILAEIKGANPGSSPQVELGRALFWDARVSLDGRTACASCHPAADWGADRRRFSPDARGALTSRHSLAFFNSVDQPMIRWLAARKSAADQAEGSLTGSLGFPSLHAGLAKLRELDYATQFRAAFPTDAEPLSTRNYGLAIQADGATVATRASCDRFLAGDGGALGGRRRAGLRLFFSMGCAACHN